MNAAKAKASSRHDWPIGFFVTAASILALMSADVRNQREITRALDRRRQLTLMSRARSAQTARKNFPLVRDKTAKRAIVLVIDEAYASFTERAAFLWSSHGLILVVVVF